MPPGGIKKTKGKTPANKKKTINIIKVNVDGSCDKGSPTSAGGIIRDSHANRIPSFSANLGISDSLHAEIWGLYIGSCCLGAMVIMKLLLILTARR